MWLNFPLFSFLGLPEGYNSRDWKPPQEAPCLISRLCEKHDGLVVEAKTIKEHWWKPHIKRLFERKVSLITCHFFQIVQQTNLFNLVVLPIFDYSSM